VLSTCWPRVEELLVLLLCDCQSLRRSINGWAVRMVWRKSLLRVWTALRELGDLGRQWWLRSGFGLFPALQYSQETFRDFPQYISQLARFDCQVRVPGLDLLSREVFQLQVRYQPVVF
jgi:hypothetical protein